MANTSCIWQNTQNSSTPTRLRKDARKQTELLLGSNILSQLWLYWLLPVVRDSSLWAANFSSLHLPVLTVLFYYYPHHNKINSEEALSRNTFKNRSSEIIGFLRSAVAGVWEMIYYKETKMQSISHIFKTLLTKWYTPISKDSKCLS